MKHTIQQFPQLTTRSEALGLAVVTTLVSGIFACLVAMAAVGWRFE